MLKGNRLKPVLYPVHISLAEQFAGALCMRVTSESVCMLREMASEKVVTSVNVIACYLVAVVETEVLQHALGSVLLVLVTAWIACYVCG